MQPKTLDLIDLTALSIGHLILGHELTDEQLDNGSTDYTMGQIKTALNKAGIEPEHFSERLAMYLPGAFLEFSSEAPFKQTEE